jgi:hypothetical protein
VLRVANTDWQLLQVLNVAGVMVLFLAVGVSFWQFAGVVVGFGVFA